MEKRWSSNSGTGVLKRVRHSSFSDRGVSDMVTELESHKNCSVRQLGLWEMDCLFFGRPGGSNSGF